MKEKECSYINWSELPLFCTYKDVMKFGMGEHEARALFDRDDFPAVEYGASKKVEKYALKRYLQKGVKK